jgi:tetratricopeptide (TPR) repeat protein
VSGKKAGVAVVLALLTSAGALPARADMDEALADYKAGRYLEAASQIQDVLDRTSSYPYGHFLLGHCMLKMKLVREAEREFRRALALDPSRAEYYQGFALALNASGNWPLTIVTTTNGLARARDPRTRYALLALRGYGWGALGRWPEAVGDFEDAQRIFPEPWVLEWLGKARFATGDHAGAIAPLEKALSVAPDDPVALRLLAECHLRLAADEPDPARKRFAYTEALYRAQRLAAISPGSLDAVQLVGRAALGAGRLAEAEDIFRHVVALDPRQCYALADLGRTYMAAARWVEAEAYLRKASACAPRLTTVYESLGDVYVKLGRDQEAAAAYLRAESIDPSRPDADLPPIVPVFAPR